LTADLPNERIPLRVRTEVREDFPDSLRRRSDLDLGMQFLQLG